MWLQRRSSIKFNGVERAACHEHRGREFVRESGVCSPGDFEICMVSPRIFELTSMLLLRTFARFIFVEAIIKWISSFNEAKWTHRMSSNRSVKSLVGDQRYLSKLLGEPEPRSLPMLRPWFGNGCYCNWACSHTDESNGQYKMTHLLASFMCWNRW